MAGALTARQGIRCRIDEAAPGRAVELVDPVGCLQADTAADVPAVLAEVEAAARRGLHAAGFVAYEAAPAFDPALRVHTPGPGGGSASAHASLPLAWFGLFARTRRASPLPVASGAVAPSGAWHSEVDAAEHGAGVTAIRAAIAAGDVYLVNHTLRFRRPWEDRDDALVLYAALASGHHGGVHVLLESDDWAVACGSPELFFTLDGNRLTTRPMKGTAPRGRWSGEDAALGEALRTSAKERAENVMVVDLLRNDLGRIALPGTVEVPLLWQVERHPAVWQLTSTVTAEARPDAGLAELFAALFPSGSVTGAPKVAAMAHIARTETSPRGVYCGAVGLVSPADGGIGARFSVAIRTAVVDRARGVVEYGSGGGITWDSDAEAEWREVRLKAAVLDGSRRGAPAMRSCTGLIETMRFDPAERVQHPHGVRNLARHLERLAASAAYHSFAVPAGLADEVAAAVADLRAPARVRLVLHHDGRLELSTSPLAHLDSPAAGSVATGPVVLCIDRVPIHSDDPALFHKTLDRRRYDERAARHPAADDVVLVNERGEVTETTRANLAARIGGRWATPPLACGLLPGIERTHLLAAGRLTEAVLRVEDLLGADAVATFSSLRGWRKATIAPACPCAVPPGRRTTTKG